MLMTLGTIWMVQDTVLTIRGTTFTTKCTVLVTVAVMWTS